MSNSIFGRYAIQASDCYLYQILRNWLDYDKPCELRFRKPKGKGYSAIVVEVRTVEQADWLERLIRQYRFKLHKLD